MTTAINPARGVALTGRGAEATPLLGFLAGEHAAAVAWVWPRPHTGFLELPAARRHAAAMALAGLGDEAVTDAKWFARIVERGRDARLADMLVGANLPGLMKALGKMGEQLWARTDYARFLDLFTCPKANRVLRHMTALEPGKFVIIEALPEPLREAGLIGQVPTPLAAEELARAFDLAVRMRGEAARVKVAVRWARAKEPQKLFQMAAESLHPETFTPPALPPDLPAPFVQITTRKDLAKLALEFKNCLRDFTGDVARGRMAVYAWRGEPKAAVALTWGTAAWRLAEAMAVDNAPLPDHALQAIVDAVVPEGVITGAAVTTLVDRLHLHGMGHHVDAPVVDTLYDRLALGDIWN